MHVSRVNPAVLRLRASRSDSNLVFGVSGILRNSALVMYDRGTFSLWTQRGVAIAGPLKGARLRQLSAERISWASWRKRYPESRVMVPPAPAADASGE